MTDNFEIAVFSGGCFWCTEAVFQRLNGVLSVSPGYAGGVADNPTYEEVSTGTTGHAEVTRIEFDPSQVAYEDLLTIFFFSHNPTTLNRQGNDIGTRYRSVIFYTNHNQKEQAEKFIENLTVEKAYDDPIVTEIVPLQKFFPAEDYHRSYYNSHRDAMYCQIIIEPKLEKLKKHYERLIKTEYKN